MSVAVTATQGGSVAVGISLLVKAVTGANASPIGLSPSATSATPSLATGTGVTTGSWVYGALLGLTGTATANGATTVQHDSAGNGLEYIQLRSTATMTGGVSATLGVTGITGIEISLLEILKGAGSLAEDAASPAAASTTSATTIATSSFSPATSLLVAMVTSNGGGGATTMTVSGGGLTWTERVKQNGAGNGYAGIWTAPYTAAALGAGMLMGCEI